MQFKHPELLWALLLLVLPIIIHLFQLRRFKKTAFTNVKLLKEVVSQSRKSNRLKKWLLLLARLGLIASLVIAFTQPFKASEKAMAVTEQVIYLDDSFSMQAQGEDGSLLDQATQALLRGIPRDQTFSLITNSRTFRNVTIKEVQESLLELEPTPHQLTLEEIQLKTTGLFSDSPGLSRELLLISDFQDQMAAQPGIWPESIQVRAALLKPGEVSNVSVDSLFISRSNPTTIEVTALLGSNGQTVDIPVSLFNESRLIAKTSARFQERREAEVVFSLPRDEEINGRIEISDNGLAYDNVLYFNLGAPVEIKVMEIGTGAGSFLSRIYVGDEFEYKSVTLGTLNYSEIEDQNLILLHDLITIPQSLQNSLQAFIVAGGQVGVIPSKSLELSNYNSFLSLVSQIKLGAQQRDSLFITGIKFGHPLYRNVFEKRIENFQYPATTIYYPAQTGDNPALTYADSRGFLIGTSGLYVFTAPLDPSVCNFTRSPLVVPTFYEMGKQSLALPDLYYLLGERAEIDLPIAVNQDEIIKVARENYEFIPMQQSYAKKTQLTFIDNPVSHGIYSILVADDSLKNISFNYPRAESLLSYSPLSEAPNVLVNSDLDELFLQMAEETRIEELWKWFVILALIFVLAEIGIQKFLR